MTEKLHLCIGGPFNGKLITHQEARKANYFPFNCANGVTRTKFARRRAEKEGRVIPPSMVLLHSSLFVMNPHRDIDTLVKE